LLPSSLIPSELLHKGVSSLDNPGANIPNPGKQNSGDISNVKVAFPCGTKSKADPVPVLISPNTYPRPEADLVPRGLAHGLAAPESAAPQSLDTVPGVDLMTPASSASQSLGTTPGVDSAPNLLLGFSTLHTSVDFPPDAVARGINIDQQHVPAPSDQHQVPSLAPVNQRPHTRLQGGLQKSHKYIDCMICYGMLASSTAPVNLAEALKDVN
jgi:hypothetical protein